MENVAVIGAGSWGTALAKVLADKGYPVTMWDRDTENLAAIAKTRTNPKYLPTVQLAASLGVEPDLAKAVAGKTHLVAVVPSHVMREVMARAAPAIDPDAIVIS